MRWLPLLLLLAACGAAVPALPGKGGPSWRELTTDHFVVWTDAADDRARELVREMEHLRQVVIGTAFRGSDDRGRSFVIALRDDAETGAFIPGAFAAMASPPTGNLLWQPVIVLSATSNLEDSELIEAHELTHVISHVVIHEQPRWFAEGVAKFFETIAIDARAGTVDLGRPPERRGAPMRLAHLVPLRTLFACKELACVDQSFYATAWALYTYLANAHPAELATLETVLAQTGDGERAWREAFGSRALEDWDQELRHWLVEGHHQILHFKVALREPAIRERPLGDADVLAIRAFMRWEFRGDDAQSRADVAAALAAEPTNVIALVMKREQDKAIDAAAARAAAQAHPDDWRAWWLAAIAAHDEEARGKACELIARDPAIVAPRGLCPSARQGP